MNIQTKDTKSQNALQNFSTFVAGATILTPVRSWYIGTETRRGAVENSEVCNA
jgi:hypothetical protein